MLFGEKVRGAVAEPPTRTTCTVTPLAAAKALPMLKAADRARVENCILKLFDLTSCISFLVFLLKYKKIDENEDSSKFRFLFAQKTSVSLVVGRSKKATSALVE